MGQEWWLEPKAGQPIAMDQDYPVIDRYEIELRFTLRVTDYAALARACLDAVMSQVDDPSDEYVRRVKRDPLHGLLTLAELALRRGMPGVDLDFGMEGLDGVSEEFVEGWPPDNPPWPDAENLPEGDD
jgi:hypothetical protein